MDLTRLSRTLSRALRHAPKDYGIELDGEGWIEVETLLAALRPRRREWNELAEEDLVRIQETSNKQRFEIAGGRIRAFYGHTLEGKIQLPPSPPPEVLFHGTTPEAARLIEAEGLLPMRRQYVHLSIDRETAERVARRRTKTPVLFEVEAGRAHAQGISFYPSQDVTWLADPVPAGFLRRLP